MPAQELTFVIRARDAFSRVVTSAGASFRGLFRSLASGAAAGAAFGATVSAFRMLGGLAAGLVRGWEDSARASGKLAQILKSTGYSANLTTSQMTELAKSISKATGASGTATKTMVGLLATFRDIKGDTFKRAAGLIADMDAALSSAGIEAGGMEASTIRLGKALNDPTRGMMALQRVGVMFNDSQREQIKQFQRSGQLAKAQALILDELQNEFGGAAEAANKATGGLATMRNAIGALKKSLGDAIANSATFRQGVDTIRKTAEDLLTSGAIELWAIRVRETLQELSPVVSFLAGLLGDLYTAGTNAAARIGAFIGAVAGGSSVGDAWAGSAGAGDRVREKYAKDLADNRRRIVEEKAAQDRTERVDMLRRQASARAARRQAIARGEAAAGYSGQDAIDLEDGTLSLGGSKPGDIPLGISGEGLSANPQKAVEQLQDRLETAKEAARQNLAGALAMEADALAALDRAGSAELANQQGTDALDARAKALGALRERIAAVRSELNGLRPDAATAGAASVIAGDPRTVRRAETRLMMRGIFRPQRGSMEDTAAGQAYYQRQLMAEAQRLAYSATAQERAAVARNLKAQQYADWQRKSAELAALVASAETEALAIERDRATLATSSDAIKAEQDRGAAAVAAAQRAQAAEAARLKALEAAGKKVAEAIAKEMVKSAADAYQTMQKAYADAKIEAIKRRPDPLVETPATARRQQVAEFMARAEADAEAEKQDEHDRRREAMLRQRLARGQRVSSKGMAFLEGRANLANAEALAAQNAADLKAAEEARDALQRDANGLLQDIRDMLKTNLEAS